MGDGFLLSDAEVVNFISSGYHMCRPDYPPGLLESICRDTDAMHGPDHQSKAPAAQVDTFGNPNDLFRRIPGLDTVLRSPVIQGALTSLVGERCRLEVHRASHYLAAGKGGQQFHQDGQFRNFGAGWNRHYRRWHLPRKVICFFYPHDVQLNQAHSEAIPGSQVYNNVPPALEADALKLNVQAGTFVIMHQNLWHRGTQELVGERRIMLKVIYDRTTEPSTPSWDHQATPIWTEDVLENSPWVPHTWDWMAGRAPMTVPSDSLSDKQTAQLMQQLNDVANDESTALRSAHILGSKGDINHIDKLLNCLELATQKLSLDSPEHKREHQASVVEETMLGTALTAFGLRGVPKVVERIDACGADFACAHFKALMLDCLTDTPGALGSQVVLQCFARCLDDASSWVRHNAMQGLELSGEPARPFAQAVSQVLASDTEPLVSFAAISTLFNSVDLERGAQAKLSAEVNELVSLLQPLKEHGNKLVAWKASETLHMIAAGQTRTCL